MIVTVALIRWSGIDILQSDFAMFYTAADLANDGRWEAVYDLDAFNRRYLALTGLPDGTGVPTFGYPPIMAQLLQPLAAAVSLPTATLVFSGLGLLAAVHGLLALGAGWRGVLLLMGFYPTVLGLSLGQNSLFSLGIVAAFAILMVRDRPLPAGAVLGVLVYKPQILASVVLFLLLSPRRHRQALLGVSITAIALPLLSWVIAPTAWREFPDGFGQLIRVSGNGFRAGRVSAIDFSYLLLGDRVLGAVLLGLGLAGLGIFWFLLNRGKGEDLEREIAAGIMLACWINPWLFVYDSVILSIPAVYVVSQGLLSRSRAWFLYSAGVLIVPLSVPLALESVRLRGWAVQWSVPFFMLAALLAFKREEPRSVVTGDG